MKRPKQTKTVDLVRFIDSFAICEDGQPLILEPHQRRILGEAFRFGKDERLKYRTIIYSAPKKSGKTAIGGLVALWFALAVDAPAETCLLANDLDQSQGRVFSACRGFIERCPTLRKEAKILNYEIQFDNGSSVRALPSDYAGAAGGNQILSIFDELWAYFSERSIRLFEEMTVPPTQPNGVRLIVSYAGYTDESILLQTLYERVFDKQGNAKPGINRPLGEDLPVYTVGDLFVYWDHIPRMPWQTPAYYESQRADLRLNTYLRLHENRWVSNESSFFEMDQWDGCVDPEHRPPLSNPRLQLWVGADASVKKDRSAVVSVYRDGNMVCLGPYATWQPSKAVPMDLEESMEAYIGMLARNYEVVEVRYDPFQFHRSASTLAKDGINMVEWPQTVGNMTDCGQVLYDAVKHRTLRLYHDDELRREASFAVGKETPRGMRIVKEKQSHKIDSIVALAMAVHAASTAPEEPEIWELPYTTQGGNLSLGLGAGRRSEGDLRLDAELRTQAEYERRKRGFVEPRHRQKREIWDRDY